MLRDAVFGHPDAKYYFIANLFVTFGWATYLYGYPFVITIAKIAAVAVLSMIVLLTSTDLWENHRRRRRESANPARQTRA
jgi:NADH:ubiquinone oxidoreductase subunit 3 (subunit A)